MTEPLYPNDDLRALAQRLASWQPPHPDTFAGRGIVICAGGATMFTNAYVLISVLRQTLGCRLPIEVWHFGAEEMSPSMAALLSELDVELVDALPRIAGAGAPIRDGWQLKPFAIRHSRFEEVLLLDADQVPVTDPAQCFDWPQYRESGAVFWPDVADLRADNPVWAALGLPPQQVRSFESGQVLVDKRRHWHALSVVEALNHEADRLYRMIYGDKDTFLVGWQLAGDASTLVPHRPFVDERCLIQRDFSGQPLFQHRTNAKWSYSGAQIQIEPFSHYEACIAALATLRARWNGRVVHRPDRPAAARQAEDLLAAAGPLTLTIDGEEAFELELLPGGEIGKGRSSDRQSWWCEGEGDDIGLVIVDADVPTLRLEPVGADQWQGRRLRAPERVVTLRAARSADDRSGMPGLVDDLLRAAGFPHAAPQSIAELAVALTLVCRADLGARRRLERLAAQSPETFHPLLAALDGERQAGSPRQPFGWGTLYDQASRDDA